jgi:hypothetical protein
MGRCEACASQGLEMHKHVHTGLISLYSEEPAIHQASDSAAMIWKCSRYDVDRDSTEQLKGKEIERKRLAILTARYLQLAMQQRRSNDVLVTGQCVITRIL